MARVAITVVLVVDFKSNIRQKYSFAIELLSGIESWNQALLWRIWNDT